MNSSIENRIKGLKDLCDMLSYATMMLTTHDPEWEYTEEVHNLTPAEHREFINHLRSMRETVNSFYTGDGYTNLLNNQSKYE